MPRVPTCLCFPCSMEVPARAPESSVDSAPRDGFGCCLPFTHGTIRRRYVPDTRSIQPLAVQSGGGTWQEQTYIIHCFDVTRNNTHGKVRAGLICSFHQLAHVLAVAVALALYFPKCFTAYEYSCCTDTDTQEMDSPVPIDPGSLS